MPVVHARTLAEAQLYANLSVLLEDTGDVRSGTPEDGREAWTVRFGDIEAGAFGYRGARVSAGGVLDDVDGR